MEKVIRVFRGFEEAEAAEIEEDRALSPEQRVAMVFELQARGLPGWLSKDLREFIELFNANRVEYLVVGAFGGVFRFGSIRIVAENLTPADPIVPPFSRFSTWCAILHTHPRSHEKTHSSVRYDPVLVIFSGEGAECRV